MGNKACGACGSDIFQQLYDKYGADFTKLMVAEKSKDVVNDQFSKLQGQSGEVFKGFQKKADGIVDEKTRTLDQLFDQVKGKVQSTVPGGIGALESIKGEKIEEFSGYNGLKSEIDGVKKKSTGRIEDQQISLQREMDEGKEMMIDKIDQQRPKIVIYEDLPDPLKRTVREQAEKTFAKEMSENKEEIVGAIASQFGLDKIQGLFGQLSPEGELSGIIGKASSTLSGVLGMGGGGQGGIGGLISQGAALFG